MLSHIPESARATYWRENSQVYSEIPDFGRGGVARVLRDRFSSGSLAPEDLAIPPNDQVLSCMDGGVQHRRGLGMGGSGLLHLPNFLRGELLRTGTVPPEERQLLDHLGRMPFRGFTSHPDCGGGEISYREVYGLKPEDPIDPRDLAEYSQEATTLVANATGKPYLGGVELSRPEGFHPTNMVIYSGIPVDVARLMNALGLTALDHPMNVYRPGHAQPETAIRDMNVAVGGVLMSAKGHGERFSPETPLGIILIGSKEIPLDQLKRELSPLLREFGARVATDGFEFPD